MQFFCMLKEDSPKSALWLVLEDKPLVLMIIGYIREPLLFQ